MAIPDFVRELRSRIGTAPLWLSGATAVVLDGDRILLIRRSDTREWAPITGIVDPAEEPAIAAAREAAEEAGVEILVERLSSTWVTEAVVYENGDRAQYLDLSFRCRYLSGEPRPLDGEALEVAWFPVAELPPMRPEFVERIRHALVPDGPAVFLRESSGR
ncbi:NUDIX domain-containing protein [Protaetiibacter intestinalis]|uniref:NUDIX domain-containing protein n=1 Tax=Protaetiibacter intestinalis TaxID=2419774 RepID=A0A387B556_9MICO|nr:NUDIX domain-containing protein [Protaetiibacter intestinalis]AYF96878.1 NUDIX domain-containing protein [Protaetiibacter intestinalis]